MGVEIGRPLCQVKNLIVILLSVVCYFASGFLSTLYLEKKSSEDNLQTELAQVGIGREWPE